MRKQFLTGLAILLPIVITLYITVWVVNIFTKPFLGIIVSGFEYLEITAVGTLSPGVKKFLLYLSKIVILFGLFFLLVFVGYLTRWYVINKLIKVSDWLFHRIPLINKVYKATQDVVHTLFKDEKTSFSQVVLVPFPNAKAKSIGLVTHMPTKEELAHSDNRMVSVFIPAVPNPTMGFLLLFRPDQIIPLKMKVEEAFKCIVSCGVMLPSSALQKMENQEYPINESN